MKTLHLTACVAGLLFVNSVAAPAPAEAPAASAVREEALVIIAHKSNPVDNLSFEELRKACLGDRRRWPNNRKVTLALLEAGRPEREAVLRQVCGMSEAEFTRHYLESEFTGQTPQIPRQLASGTLVRRFVFNVPGALGFVRARDVDDTVKVVKLEGRPPSDSEYRLRLSAKEEPKE